MANELLGGELRRMINVLKTKRSILIILVLVTLISAALIWWIAINEKFTANPPNVVINTTLQQPVEVPES